MTVPPKTDAEHRLLISGPHLGFDPPRYSVACSCGEWSGGRVSGKEAAILAHEAHVQSESANG